MSFMSERNSFNPAPLGAATDHPLPAHSDAVSPRSGHVYPALGRDSEMHKYVVTVETGKSRWAGTAEEVRVQLFGDRGVTEEIPLREADNVAASLRYAAPSSSPTKVGFSEDSVREFKFVTPFVGNLVKIRVFHGAADDHDHAASWRLERVVVSDDTLVRTWAFPCQMWLTRDSGNEVELLPTPEIAAGRRASMRLSRRRSVGPHELAPTSTVALLASRFSNNGPVTQPTSSNAAEGGVRRVCFQLQKDDVKEGYMYLFGAISALGSWETTRAHRMIMQTGADGTWRGEWRLELEIDDDYDTIEYKYIHVDEKTDRVFFSDKSCWLKLSDVSNAANRTVEGGVIYVRDTFTPGTGKSNFLNGRRPNDPRTPQKSASNLSTLGGVISPPASDPKGRVETPTPHKRNTLGFIQGGGSAFLFSEADSSLQATEGESGFTEILDDSKLKTPEPTRKQDHSVPDSTAKLRTELKVTSALLSSSKEQLQEKNAEIQRLKENLDKFSDGNVLTTLLGTIDGQSERTSPVSSESLPEEDNLATANNEAGFLEKSPNRLSDIRTAEEADNDEATQHTPTPAPASPAPSAPVISVLEAEETEPAPALTTPRSFPISGQSDVSGPTTPLPAELHRQSERLLSAKKVRRDALEAQREVRNLKKILDDLNVDMTQQCAAYESRQVELVHLVMDYKENRLAERDKLISERDEIYESWTREFTERRKLFNTIQELRGNIRVYCRVRPLKEPMLTNGVRAGMAVSFPNANIGDNISIQANSKTFEFSHIFHPKASQEAVYRETSGVIGSVLDGYNVCVFAYGQTGSGKTHTMNGPPEDRGVNFRALTDLFEMAKDRADYCSTSIVVSMIEIYNDSLKDLIYDAAEHNNSPPPKLEIRKDSSQASKTAVHIPNLTEIAAASVEDVWDVMERGAHNRAMSATSMNEHSSRSHLILRVRVFMENTRTNSQSHGLLSLVDLAGSERVSRSNASGERLREAQHINKSLATLGDVFTALLQKSGHVPYRNSKLTYLLQDSLGGDSKTLMFVNVSCDESDLSETLSSLQFAQRVAKVELGNARKHTENSAASKAIASLGEKEAQNQSLHAQNLALQRELKKRDQLIEEHKAKLRHAESELKNAAKTLDEKRKREGTERGGLVKEVRELRRADEKHEAEIRTLKLKIREISRTKEDEVKKLKHLLEDKEKKMYALEKRIKASSSRLAARDNLAGSASSNSLVETASETSTDSGPRARPTNRRPLQRSATVGGSRSRHARSDGTSEELSDGQNGSGSFPRLSARAGAARNGTHGTRRATRPFESLSSEATGLAPRRASRLQDSTTALAPRRASRLNDGPELGTRLSAARRAGRIVGARSNNETSAPRRTSRLQSARSNETETPSSYIAGNLMEPSQTEDEADAPLSPNRPEDPPEEPPSGPRRASRLYESRRASSAQVPRSSTVASRMNRQSSPTSISTGPRDIARVESEGTPPSGPSSARSLRPPRHSAIRPPMRRAVSSLTSSTGASSIRRATTYADLPSSRGRAARSRPRESSQPNN